MAVKQVGCWRGDTRPNTTYDNELECLRSEVANLEDSIRRLINEMVEEDRKSYNNTYIISKMFDCIRRSYAKYMLEEKGKK